MTEGASKSLTSRLVDNYREMTGKYPGAAFGNLGTTPE
jgi:hypothetical protein